MAERMARWQTRLRALPPGLGFPLPVTLWQMGDALWLAVEGERPVGVLLATESPEWESWEIAYIGVVPEARGRGFGRELMVRALAEARAAEISHLTLSVDARNAPAIGLYRVLGFERRDTREVYLAVLENSHS